MSAFRFTILAGILVLLTACGSSSTPATPTTPTTTSNPATGSNTVSIPAGAQNLGTAGYAPNPITVAVGSTVTWTNTDSTAHTASSDTGVFNSGTIPPGGSANFTFSTAGTYPYHCNFHPGMVGSVVVQ